MHGPLELCASPGDCLGACKARGIAASNRSRSHDLHRRVTVLRGSPTDLSVNM